MKGRTVRERQWIVALVLLACPALSWGSSGTEGASFLDIPVGAGPAALGSDYSAAAADAYCPIYNPSVDAACSTERFHYGAGQPHLARRFLEIV